MKLSKNNAGFSMIEMLIVAVIIGLLVGMLMKGVATARESGRRVACMANLRQLALATNMYTSENKGQMPPFCYKLTPVGGGQYVLTNETSWSVANVGPGASKALLTCPSDKAPVTVGNMACSFSYNFIPFMLGERAINLQPGSLVTFWDGDPKAMVSSIWWGTPDCTPDEDDKVTICHKPGDPSEQTKTLPVSALSGHLGHGDYCGPCNLSSTAENLSQMNKQVLARRHFKKVNAIFLDGHAAWVTDLPDNSLD